MLRLLHCANVVPSAAMMMGSGKRHSNCQLSTPSDELNALMSPPPTSNGNDLGTMTALLASKTGPYPPDEPSWRTISTPVEADKAMILALGMFAEMYKISPDPIAIPSVCPGAVRQAMRGFT